MIGSAGSEEKVKRLLEVCGFDAAFNYKTGPVPDQLNLAAPDGIDVYFPYASSGVTTLPAMSVRR